MVTERKVGRLHKRPGQILVAVLAIVLAFFLPLDVRLLSTQRQ
jgi:hypothetical protein